LGKSYMLHMMVGSGGVKNFYRHSTISCAWNR
jgi:hypothetical protein